MDCGTCEVASPITVEQPETVEVSLTITDAAQTMLAEAGLGHDDEDMALLVGVLSGGCSGYLYDMKIMEKPESDQFQIQDFDGVKVYIHNNDSALLNGIELDFKDTLMGGGFNITNPNASRACGCGQSFG